MDDKELALELGVWQNPWTKWWEFTIPGGAAGGYDSFEECLEAAMEWHVEQEIKRYEVTYE